MHLNLNLGVKVGSTIKSLRLLKIKREEIWHNDVGMVTEVERLFDGYWKFSGVRGTKRIMFSPKPNNYHTLVKIMKEHNFIFIKEFGELAQSLYM